MAATPTMAMIITNWAANPSCSSAISIAKPVTTSVTTCPRRRGAAAPALSRKRWVTPPNNSATRPPTANSSPEVMMRGTTSERRVATEVLRSKPSMSSARSPATTRTIQ